MYKVIKFFTDLHDNDHPYDVGDTFPRPGIDVSENRLEELASTSNKRKEILIEKVEEPKEEVKEAPKKAAPKKSKKATEK